MLAFARGLASAILYYKDRQWISGLILAGLPIQIVALFGWPHDTDFVDTALFSVVLWVVLGLFGLAVDTAAIVLRIVR